MKKIIFLFLIFSAMLFAKWEVGTGYLTSGEPITTFTTYDLEESGSYIDIGVSVEYDISVFTIGHNLIKKGDPLYLIITDNEDNDINCQFYSDDVENREIRVPVKRSSILTKMIYNGKSAILVNTKTDKILALFDLSGIKQIMQKHVGKSYWYKYKLND